MKATRRSAVTASGLVALGLAGCTADSPSSSSGASSPSATTATETVRPDPDRLALEQAFATSAALLAAIEEASPQVDIGGRFAALHSAHLSALRRAAGATAPTTDATPHASGDLTAKGLRKREVSAQRELARLAQQVASGSLSRLLASMSAGIAAGLSRRGEAAR